jgi:hypothetical protein
MKTSRGLKIQVEAGTKPPRAASAIYLLSEDIVDVYLEPRTTSSGGSFVRTASIHFDLDPNGDISHLEILGGPRSTWKICNLQRPERAKMALVRFQEPEQCEEEENEIFETNELGNLLRIICMPESVAQYVEVARGLVFGISEADELVEIWISDLSISD